MRIVHLTVMRQLTRGQAKQLSYEYAASAELADVEWITLAYHNGPAEGAFIRTIPFFFRPILLRNLYGWIVALRLSRVYDVVLMRHMAFDPFSIIFARFMHNRVTVHHSKEAEELRLIRKGWKGRLASAAERLTGACSARHARALVGVTYEIAKYELEFHSVNKPIGVYPNGIEPREVVLLEDERSNDTINAVFICGKFSDWHGLDKLIAAVRQRSLVSIKLPLAVHLIGSLSDEQEKTIAEEEELASVFRVYGLMDEAAYRPILAKCDFGITSLALERKNLSEASTLKVREMLAMGLPVYSAHKDVALSGDKAFVAVVSDVCIDDIFTFGERVKEFSRSDVREKSLSNITKVDAMKSLCDQLLRKL